MKKTITALLAVGLTGLGPVVAQATPLNPATTLAVTETTTPERCDFGGGAASRGALPDTELIDITDKGHWVNTNGRWWWQNNDGTWPAFERVRINGSVYFFGKDGYMQIGWAKDHWDWYYYNQSGAQLYGWLKDGGNWYYLDPVYGAMLRQRVSIINGTSYAFEKNGAMSTTWPQNTPGWNSHPSLWDDSLNWYYFDAAGNPVTGWLKDGGHWYYLNSYNGNMETWRAKIDGKNYAFAKNGIMLTGWVYDYSWDYYNKDGQQVYGWLNTDGHWYHLNPCFGYMETGKQKIKDVNYFFDNSGAMVTGWVKLEDGWHYYGKSGAQVTGWRNIDGHWYYLQPGSGIMQTGTLTIDGKTYEFDDNGALIGDTKPDTNNGN